MDGRLASTQCFRVGCHQPKGLEFSESVSLNEVSIGGCKLLTRASLANNFRVYVEMRVLSSEIRGRPHV